MPDLVKEDFTVLDNGVPREITLLLERRPADHRRRHARHERQHVQPRFIRLRSSTQSFVDALLPQDRAQIGTFGDEIAISPHLTGDKPVLRRVLRDELWPMGGTPIWNALDAAMTGARIGVRPARGARRSPTA